MDQQISPSEAELQRAVARLCRGCDDIISRVELEAKLRKSRQTGQPLRVKLGLDPTAPDIHLGFAVVLKKLRLFQDLGHQAHLIIGDFTARIGDPSGKSKTRPQLTREQVEANAQTYQDQLFRILDRSRTEVHFNGDWLDKMTFSDVIELASKYTVAQTLEREDFAQRLETGKPVSLHEILYPLCQGQDSVAISSDVEMGGTDQRFNNLVGRELQRANGQEPQVVMLMPILIGTDGVQKMSKSLGNYIGINDAPAEMFGKVMSIPDSALRTYFTLCTEVPTGEVDELLAGHPMAAKQHLAANIVGQYWGAASAVEAQEQFDRQFSQREAPEELPEVAVPLGQEMSVVELLRTCFGITGGEAKRMLVQNAVTIDGSRVADPHASIIPAPGMVLKMGKRRWARIQP